MYPQKETIDPISEIENLQADFLGSKSLESRKLLGQYFTGSSVSNYMASLIKPIKKDSIRLLDAGAGNGILTASSALQCLNLDIKNVHAVLYEIDELAIDKIRLNMELVASEFEAVGANFSYEIINDDFILTRPDKNDVEPFDISVINPPYFKYNVKTSPYSKAVADLYKGDPNIYASFMAVVCACLVDNGQLISITPRSFTNGLYFKGFRSFLLSQSALELIHIFKSRNKVFNDKTASILQENIICRFIKGQNLDEVEIRTSDCSGSISQTEDSTYSKNFIIDEIKDQNIIRIPESKYEAQIMLQAEKFNNTFEEVGYFISTGPVVEHRTREYISEEKYNNNSVPLYRPHNVTPLKAGVTFEHKKDVCFLLDEGHEKHTLKNNNFVLLKRLSSKDEKRRLVAAIHFADSSNTEYIGFGNKVNYLGVKGKDLEEVEAFGLAALFNSTFFDMYFRCLSGNTQVNATEIRILKFPTREQVKEIGQEIKKLNSFDTLKIDTIVNPIIGVNVFS